MDPTAHDFRITYERVYTISGDFFKLSSTEINARFLFNEHDDLPFLLPKFVLQITLF